MANGSNTGSCMCGSVAYRLQGAHIWCSYCHCDSCRKASGAALTVFVGFEDERIELLKGEPRIYKSSAGIEQAFCQACGTSLWYRDARLPKTTYFLLGTLDEPEQFKPEHHAWESKRLRWLEIDDGAQRHSKNSVPRRPTW